MTVAQIMEFVTITTGATSIARRAELSADTMTLARELMDGAQNPQGWSVEITASHPTSHCWSISMSGEEICYCFLCVDQMVNDQMWEAAESLAPEQTVLHRPRGVPWLAVSLSPAIIGLPPELQLALPWLETALAWAFLEG
jgi:hypothetical protein